MDDIYSKLGRPAEPKDYELGTNGEDPITDQFAETLAGVLHTNGISKDAGSAIFKAIGDYVTKAADEKETADAAENTAAWDDLKSRWGDDFDVNSVLAKEVVKQLGVDKETVDALEAALGQSAKVVEFFAHLGSKTRTELPFIGSANSGGNPVLTPEAAKQELDQLRADPSWAKRFLEGDVGVRRQCDSLSRIAAKAM